MVFMRMSLARKSRDIFNSVTIVAREDLKAEQNAQATGLF